MGVTLDCFEVHRINHPQDHSDRGLTTVLILLLLLLVSAATELSSSRITSDRFVSIIVVFLALTSLHLALQFVLDLLLQCGNRPLAFLRAPFLKLNSLLLTDKL
jgi:hypothetical protein